MSTTVEQADAIKAEANVLLKEKKYEAAIAKYTAAIELNPNNAIYFANRSYCNLHSENYGSAIQDASEAIRIDSKYAKGYYRRACGYLSLGKFKEATADFASVVKLAPKNKATRQRYLKCKQAYKEQLFLESIYVEEAKVSAEIDINSIQVPSDYGGVHLPETLTKESVMEMVESFREQKPLHTKYCYQIVLEALKIVKELPTLVDITIKDSEEITIFGDVHGQYYDVLNIFKLNGYPGPDNPVLFNGDLVDRGSWSVEVILTVLAFKVLYPEHVHIARGNHETKSMNKMYGFEGEVKAKYSEKCMDLFSELFCALPIVHLINEKVFVTHGGLFENDNVTLDEIRKVDRFKEPPEKGVMCELLWSDPLPNNKNGREMSKRGVGVQFGADVTQSFLEKNNLEWIVRSHEVRDEGYSIEHNGKLITIFSAPNYCDQMGNKGAFVKFGTDLKPKFTQFTHVPHPDLKPMHYASMYNSMGM